jgi:PIN domain
VIMLIDANIYLDLFRMVAGRKLLAFLEEQQAHIFISQQIVHEVTRNKLNVAKKFLPDQFVTVSMAQLPDHLFGLNDRDIADLKRRLNQAKQASEDLEKIAAEALILIGKSEDDVSRRLAPLFQNAIQPSPDEVTRARSRKERGNPPGKPSGPLGDEIIWEQFLSYAREKRPRAWIVTRDGDYCTALNKRTLALNPMLYGELRQAGVSDIRCFRDLLEASEDFAKNSGVTTKAVPTPEQSKDIRKEIDALPPLYFSHADDSWMVAANNALRLQALVAATAMPSAGTVFGEIKALPQRNSPEDIYRAT